jgi:hypothetical protein
MTTDKQLIVKKGDNDKSSPETEISYVLIKVERSNPIEDILQKIATTINIQLTSGEEQEQNLLPLISSSLIWLLATVYVYLLPYRQLEGFLNLMSERMPRLIQQCDGEL